MDNLASSTIQPPSATLYEERKSEAIGHNAFAKHFLIQHQSPAKMGVITSLYACICSNHDVVDTKIWVLDHVKNIGGIAERTTIGEGAKEKKTSDEIILVTSV
ncbi:hypothetical protein SESBI_07245 [Sesbania bispinosa]|nr:hypothetical protein SESBI_07245 [Sesbania bispinosa]